MKKAAREYHKSNRTERNRRHKEWIKDNAARNAQQSAKYNASKRSATPKWRDKEEIAAMYEKAQWLTDVTGEIHSVDHIDPLSHASVCGLHVAANLQILTKNDNSAKRNDFTPGGNKPYAKLGLPYGKYD